MPARQVTTPDDPSIGPPRDTDEDYSWPVVGYLTDGVFGNWAFYSLCLFGGALAYLVIRQLLRDWRGR